LVIFNFTTVASGKTTKSENLAQHYVFAKRSSVPLVGMILQDYTKSAALEILWELLKFIPSNPLY